MSDWSGRRVWRRAHHLAISPAITLRNRYASGTTGITGTPPTAITPF
jgi:hypothetical protein